MYFKREIWLQNISFRLQKLLFAYKTVLSNSNRESWGTNWKFVFQFTP